MAEIDVTESFSKAALIELIAHGDVPLNDIEAQIKTVIEAFPLLDKQTCAMQSLTHMSELDR